MYGIWRENCTMSRCRKTACASGVWWIWAVYWGGGGRERHKMRKERQEGVKSYKGLGALIRILDFVLRTVRGCVVIWYARQKKRHRCIEQLNGSSPVSNSDTNSQITTLFFILILPNLSGPETPRSYLETCRVSV